MTRRTHMEIVAELEDMVKGSFRVGSKVLADWRHIQELLRELADSLPQEYRDAQEILTSANAQAAELRKRAQQTLDAAKADADDMLDEAQQRAQILVSDHQIVDAAKQRAIELARNADAYSAATRDDADRYADSTQASAEDYAETTRRSADDYALRVLNQLRNAVTRAMASIDDGMHELRK